MTTQQAAIAFMTAKMSREDAKGQHLETHISHVFLIGDHAFKMKKAVSLAFVDFSTLTRRKAACEGELEVNRRTAATIYLDVVALLQEGKHFWLTKAPPDPASGSVIEYFVRMRRFPQNALLDRLGGASGPNRPVIDAFADAVAGLHHRAGIIASDAVPQPFERTVADLTVNLGRALPPKMTAPFDAWRAAVQPRTQELIPRLRARARRGAVRHGHGDLHLRNACLFEGEVLLFDAIEFDPRLSHVDVLYDAAFAVMDLRHRGLEASAIQFLSRYLMASRDYAGIGCLRPFISVRAAIRAMVTALNDDMAESAAYLDLAVRALEDPARPRLIAIGGRSGTGKSTLARALAPQLGPAPTVVVLRSDEIRKRLMGQRPEDTLGPAGYTPAVSAAVYRRLTRDAGRALSQGASVITDAAFLEKGDRIAVAEVAAQRDTAFLGIWLSAPDAVLEARLNGRTGDASDADAEVMHRQPRLEVVEGWLNLRTDHADPSRTTALLPSVLEALGIG